MPLAQTSLKYPSVVPRNTTLPSQSTIAIFNEKGKKLLIAAENIQKQVDNLNEVEISIRIPKRILPVVSALFCMRMGISEDVDHILHKKMKCTSNELMTANQYLDRIELMLAQKNKDRKG